MNSETLNSIQNSYIKNFGCLFLVSDDESSVTDKCLALNEMEQVPPEIGNAKKQKNYRLTFRLWVLFILGQECSFLLQV